MRLYSENEEIILAFLILGRTENEAENEASSFVVNHGAIKGKVVNDWTMVEATDEELKTLKQISEL